MIVRKTLDFRIIIKRTWKRMLTLFLISFVVSIGYWFTGDKWLIIDSLPASILGVAIAFLIGFRVNSAYERWWEARKIWGAIVNDWRSITRQITTLLTTDHAPDKDAATLTAIKKRMVYRHIAFAYALRNALRKQEVGEAVREFVGDDDFAYLLTQKNIPNAILQRQAEELQQAHAARYIDDFRHMQIDFKLSALCDSMGAAERIKNTVFPRQYSFYSTQFVRIYTYLLPFVLVERSGWLCIPSTLLIGFIFFALDTIAGGIENPFENNINDIPLSAICRTIEINLKQQLGETDVPPPLEPVNGFLL